MSDLKVVILVPAYKRPEYTKKCIEAFNNMVIPCHVEFWLWDDGSCDGTKEIFETLKHEKTILSTTENYGLRYVISCWLHDPCQIRKSIDIIAKMDNDSIVPPDYLVTMLNKFLTTDADILSPNVYPSNAAYTHGNEDMGLGYRPSHIVGGLWMMKREMVDGLEFDRHDVVGIKGAFNLLYQIIIEKEPKIGWVPEVVVQDIGHWSGAHPEHIKSTEHAEYYNEIGRSVSWA